MADPANPESCQVHAHCPTTYASRVGKLPSQCHVSRRIRYLSEAFILHRLKFFDVRLCTVWPRRCRARMEQRRSEGAGEAGPVRFPLTKILVTQPGFEPGLVGGEQSNHSATAFPSGRKARLASYGGRHRVLTRSVTVFTIVDTLQINESYDRNSTHELSRTRHRNGVTCHRQVGALFANKHLVTYSPADKPANREPSAACGIQSTVTCDHTERSDVISNRRKRAVNCAPSHSLSDELYCYSSIGHRDEDVRNHHSEQSARLCSLMYKYADINCTLVVYCHSGSRRLGQRSLKGVEHRVDQWLNVRKWPSSSSEVGLAPVGSSAGGRVSMASYREDNEQACSTLPPESQDRVLMRPLTLEHSDCAVLVGKWYLCLPANHAHPVSKLLNSDWPSWVRNCLPTKTPTPGLAQCCTPLAHAAATDNRHTATVFTTFAAEKRGSGKGYTATLIKGAIALKREALNLRAVFSSLGSYLWDFMWWPYNFIGSKSAPRFTERTEHVIDGDHGVREVRLLAFHQGEPGSVPGRFTPDFRMCDSCRTMTSVGGFSQGSRVSPPFHSGVAPYSSHFTLIGYQDLAVKSRRNLFTHSLTYMVRFFKGIFSPRHLGFIVCLNNGVLRANEGEARRVWSGAGMHGRRKQGIPEKTRRQAASSGMIPTTKQNFLVLIVNKVQNVDLTEWLDRTPPSLENQVRFPAGSPHDFPMWESCRTMALVGGFSRVSPPPPQLVVISDAAPYSICSALIGSQDLDVKKGRQNLFTLKEVK
ncbi:hypothetical protein PR048_012195 [Dryococelus australis]|uniref:Uncharacterized protein n=1 Tax=Dryococelus australis TaxID=614101 RepID=A0ABQ9HNN6_9NEOP|nr:hypothetical protein PR048_012195 [Dryococelus australis]